MTDQSKSVPPFPITKGQQAVKLEQLEIQMGPLPPASQFAEYERILPGSAERILKMAENQASHRQEMERKVIEANIRSEKRGQWFGLIATIFVLGAVCFSIYYKQPIATAILGFGGISGLISAFITAHKKAKEDTQPPSTKKAG